MDRFLQISAVVSAFLAAAALLAIAIIAIAEDTDAPPADAQIPVPTPAPATPATPVQDAHIEEPDAPDRELPSLTENQIEKVKSLLSADPSLKTLLAGESYAIEGMGPWVSGEEWEFIGALVEIAPDSPVDYEGFLPTAESYEKPEDGSGDLYVDGGRSYRLRAQGIEKLDVLVDLNKGKVVTIEVSRAASVNIDYGYGEVWSAAVYYAAGLLGILLEEVEKAAGVDIGYEYGFY